MEPIILKYLPKKMLSKALSLNSIGICNVAFRYRDITLLIDILRSHKICILGGDVVELATNNSPTLNYDNWATERGPGEAFEDLRERSYLETIKYIENYPKKEEENILFALVIDDPNDSIYV